MSNYLPLDLVLIFIMCFFVLLGYVRLQTSHGDLNLELHCEMVRKSKSLKFEIFRIGNNNIKLIHVFELFFRRLLKPLINSRNQSSNLNVNFIYIFQVTKTCENFIKLCSSGYYDNTSKFN